MFVWWFFLLILIARGSWKDGTDNKLVYNSSMKSRYFQSFFPHSGTRPNLFALLLASFVKAFTYLVQIHVILNFKHWAFFLHFAIKEIVFFFIKHAFSFFHSLALYLSPLYNESEHCLLKCRFSVPLIAMALFNFAKHLLFGSLCWLWKGVFGWWEK